MIPMPGVATAVRSGITATPPAPSASTGTHSSARVSAPEDFPSLERGGRRRRFRVPRTVVTSSGKPCARRRSLCSVGVSSQDGIGSSLMWWLVRAVQQWHARNADP